MNITVVFCFRYALHFMARFIFEALSLIWMYQQDPIAQWLHPNIEQYFQQFAFPGQTKYLPIVNVVQGQTYERITCLSLQRSVVKQYQHRDQQCTQASQWAHLQFHQLFDQLIWSRKFLTSLQIGCWLKLFIISLKGSQCYATIT